MTFNKSAPDDFWRKIDKTSHCWKWLRAHFRSGYARVKYCGKDTVAHRIAWIITNGPIPQGLELDHLCRNRWCVNPSHLEAVTHRENEIRGNTVIRKNYLKTSCDKGHPFQGENLFIRNDGRRMCRTCKRNGEKKNRNNDVYRKKHALYERARRLRRKQNV